eukprot:12929746-Prorocentrum_lima.AAC.1
MAWATWVSSRCPRGVGCTSGRYKPRWLPDPVGAETGFQQRAGSLQHPRLAFVQVVTSKPVKLELRSTSGSNS